MQKATIVPIFYFIFFSLIFSNSLNAGWWENTKEAARSAKFLWGERKPLKEHLTHVSGAYKDIMDDGQQIEKFATKVVKVSDNIQSFDKDVSSFNVSKIRSAIGDIDYLASN
ncbi:hypothetical protein ACFL35_08300, partial [Candidatus Riflebacteria bacterium]